MNCINNMMLGSFSIKHLDILSYADIVPAVMRTTADRSGMTYIHGNDLLGSIKITEVVDGSFAISAYFQAQKGRFSFTHASTINRSIVILGVDHEPKSNVTVNNIEQGFVINSYFDAGKFVVVLGDFNSLNNVTYIQDNPSENPIVTFEITSSQSMNVYIDYEFVGAWHSNNALKLPQYYQIVAQEGLTQLDFDLREAYASLNYKMPAELEDGIYYHLTSHGEILGSEVKVGDFVQFHDQQSWMLHFPQSL
ncbi:hypothetical protein GCM10025882_31150 [Acinetobacter gyllenbergii]|uniref:Uncharacterized protein n=1 Tax=Acinetobacter gyllenbergii CIP 110306 = MTCC 11365 TaxID=1217657 RepID=A0A829HH21_9GAMM|nr:hypothetical protein [Acinetobacter gyllenbergii]EPF81482.1 hypothetical protein F957_02022 [Acinetobacter gyllenbergii CIP 110306 = MTCC 11365]EPH36119.1 hypothetical protein L293_0713 [Acinetobacter gyllenbergii CIP 110306 = MTCC 11365]ESK54236.1 hypothetical protein F987_00804 [Acinetobacter gyllenbergii NIPH 230]GMA12690.1 hypothetical protein GCM10025882_31150 [Acinetobacter gyllenbergii]